LRLLVRLTFYLHSLLLRSSWWYRRSWLPYILIIFGSILFFKFDYVFCKNITYFTPCHLFYFWWLLKDLWFHLWSNYTFISLVFFLTCLHYWSELFLRCLWFQINIFIHINFSFWFILACMIWCLITSCNSLLLTCKIFFV